MTVPYQIVCPNKIGPYQIHETIGTGAFATVKIATRPDIPEKLACKVIAKKRLDMITDKSRFEQEIRIHQTLNHPNIVQLVDLYKDTINYYILMEYCPKGELLSHIVSKKRFTEAEAKLYFRQLLDGLNYLHSNQIAHRDLKPENLLFSQDMTLKISDFSLSKTTANHFLTSTSCGSPCYASPEIISGQPYDPIKTDMWSAGVILYAMICGVLPWTKVNQIQLFHQIKNARFTIPQHVSESCADLILKLLTTNLDVRLSSSEALTHKFMVESIPKLIHSSCHDCTVSLKKLDEFFEKNVNLKSVENVESAIPRSPSFGELKFANPFCTTVRWLTLAHSSSQPNYRKIQISNSTARQISQSNVLVTKSKSTSTVDQVFKWKDVVKTIRKKQQRPYIIKPQARFNSIAVFKA